MPRGPPPRPRFPPPLPPLPLPPPPKRAAPLQAALFVAHAHHCPLTPSRRSPAHPLHPPSRCATVARPPRSNPHP
eukprot:3115080-Prymnesium_polylepis.3